MIDAEMIQDFLVASINASDDLEWKDDATDRPSAGALVASVYTRIREGESRKEVSHHTPTVRMFLDVLLWAACMLGIAAILVCAAGCTAPTRRHLSLGVSFPTHTGLTQQTLSMNGSGESIDVVRFEYGPTWEWQHDGWAMDVGIHSGVTLVVGEQDGGPGIGASVMLRPRLQLEGIEPYVRLAAGMEWYHGSIETQGTPWGFPLSAGVGFRVPLDHVGWLAVDFTLWHFSNGTKVFGHGLGPNPGVNTDLARIAFEIPF